MIIRMATANPLWGAPRIHGELLKLGIDIAERTVSRLMPKRRGVEAGASEAATTISRGLYSWCGHRGTLAAAGPRYWAFLWS